MGPLPLLLPLLLCAPPRPSPAFTTGPGSYTSQPGGGAVASPTPSFTTSPPAFTSGHTPNTTGQPVAGNSGTPTFTGASPTFTTGAVSNTTGAAVSATTGAWAAPMGVTGYPGLLRDGVWVGRHFFPGPRAAPPPPLEVRDAYTAEVEKRVSLLEPRLDALKEKVFAYNGDQREALGVEVAALHAAQQQWRAALGNVRDVVPQSFNAMKEEWDAALADLETRAAKVDAALLAP